MAIDPICKMTVDERKALHLHVKGEDYFFCSAHCKSKFEKSSAPSPIITPAPHGQGVYTCPMHPEIKQDHPGDCPKCGMPLEPAIPSAEAGHEGHEVKVLSKRFWIGVALTVPLVILVLGEMLPVLNTQAFISMQASAWLQLLLATPVVVFCGGFLFVKGWQSLINRWIL